MTLALTFYGIVNGFVYAAVRLVMLIFYNGAAGEGALPDVGTGNRLGREPGRAAACRPA